MQSQRDCQILSTVIISKNYSVLTRTCRFKDKDALAGALAFVDDIFIRVINYAVDCFLLAAFHDIVCTFDGRWCLVINLFEQVFHRFVL